MAIPELGHTLTSVEAPIEDGNPDEGDFDEWSPEVMARSYEHGQRSGRRISAAVLGAVIAFDLVIAWLVAGWIVAVSLAAPQMIAAILIIRRPLGPNPYAPRDGREDPDA